LSDLQNVLVHEANGNLPAPSGPSTAD